MGLGEPHFALLGIFVILLGIWMFFWFFLDPLGPAL